MNFLNDLSESQNLSKFGFFFPHWLESYSIAEMLYFKIEEIIRPTKLPFNDIFLKH